MSPSDPNTGVWEESVGFLPFKVSVYEEPSRKGTLYLRWRQDGNWKKRSLQRPLRTARGRIDTDTKRWALGQAQEQYAKLVAGIPVDRRVPQAPLTIQQGLDKIVDPQTGKYPTDTAHRREVMREIARAVKLLGEKPWAELKKADIRRLWRHRIRELRTMPVKEGQPKIDGLRGSEITVSRLLAVAQWLRDEELVPAGSCVPKRKWKEDLRADWIELTGERALPEVKRPRHTLEEMRKIIAKAGEVDPRFELAMALGAEQRLGQVLRCRRTDVSLEHATLTVRGKGHKRGVVVKLTGGQLRLLKHHLETGYLRELERHMPDYPLFPAGQMPGGRSGKAVATVARHGNAKQIDRSVLDGWFHAAEDLAGVVKVKGRAAYGVRRAAVDAVKALKISREGLKEHGGWTDTQMPDTIYADQVQEYARDEARDRRADIRGETE